MCVCIDKLISQDMYSNWPWFRTLIDLLEMILVKSDYKIAENYDAQLVTDPVSLQLGKELRGRLQATEKAVLEVSGHSHLQVHLKCCILIRSINLTTVFRFRPLLSSYIILSCTPIILPQTLIFLPSIYRRKILCFSAVWRLGIRTWTPSMLSRRSC